MSNEKELVKKLRDKYTKNPPEGMTPDLIKSMSDNDLLDMDYFLNEDVFGDEVGEEGFYIF
ncbi:hypothetical protein M2454_000243 [Aequitasia blattaphilus]|uniref:Uncharacterized protein n=2 Tax=Lachnospiraceae TaxID=186803 RepID=A0ABT1EL23_9FIRM|nr:MULTISPECIES: hypothetical protein [Lachnospiraceae]MDL2250134.1 hypothetical protein [Lachnospiraceae bacterium OttesenSCG-928-J05]MCP1101022.1 hypothetical protein [Aequitasia blattaphilus]MCP1111393.1 hypothetical protein [Ohessyouella blattaphilus]MCR8564787.1 hypothetical protein [Ohessyouella blattaphilus]MCR8613662.1 hypothetical protein [Aequitasia blattaphilus]